MNGRETRLYQNRMKLRYGINKTPTSKSSEQFAAPQQEPPHRKVQDVVTGRDEVVENVR